MSKYKIGDRVIAKGLKGRADESGVVTVFENNDLTSFPIGVDFYGHGRVSHWFTAEGKSCVGQYQIEPEPPIDTQGLAKFVADQYEPSSDYRRVYWRGAIHALIAVAIGSAIAFLIAVYIRAKEMGLIQ